MINTNYKKSIQNISSVTQISANFSAVDYNGSTNDMYNVEIPEKYQDCVDSRKAEFVAGRHCAAKALRSINPSANTAVGVNSDRSPIWPEGFIGSITHTNNFVSAMVARTSVVRGIGIDSEEIISESTASEIKEIVGQEEEYALFASKIESSQTIQEFITILFSAKESIYKCLYPQVNKFFDFHDVKITDINLETGKFYYTVVNELNSEFTESYTAEGNFKIENGAVHTSTILYVNDASQNGVSAA
jgi:enterobactin synthetase component D